MAVLPEADRDELLAKMCRDFSKLRESTSLTKPDLRAAIDAADLWADTNSAAYNTALPQPARAELTAKQKAMLLMLVITRRWEVT